MSVEQRRLVDLAVAPPAYGSGAAAKPYTPGSIRYVRITDMADDGRLRREGRASISQSDAAGYELRPNDLLFARSGSVGKTYLYESADGPCAHAGYVIKFSLDPMRCDPRYVAQFVRTESYWRWVNRTLRQGAQPNINAQEYASLSVPCPPIEEQHRIAAILDQADARVDLARRESAKLRLLYASLRESLLRDEEEAGAEKVQLASVVDVNPQSLGAATPGSFAFRYLDISSVTGGVISWSDVHEMTFRAAPSRARRVVLPDDSLFCTVRPLLRAHAFLDRQRDLPVICSTGFAVLRPRATVAPRYLFHVLFSTDFELQVGRAQVGSNYPAVNEADVARFTVPMPPLPRQNQIATALDRVLALAALREEEADKVAHLKAGLADSLFSHAASPTVADARLVA